MGIERKRFAVAGGGIGGLSIAYALAELGHEIEVLEQAADFSEVGAGVQLGPNGVRALRALGLEERITAFSWQPDGLHMRDGYDGSDVVRLPTGSDFADRYDAPYFVIHRADLLEILLTACRDHPAINLRNGARIAGYAEGSGQVVVKVDGSDPVNADAVIGADGLRSAIRSQITGDGEPPLPRHVVYRGVVPRDMIADHLWSPSVTMWVGHDADFVHYPLRRGELFNLVVTFRADRELDPGDVSGSYEDMCAPFKGFAAEVHELLELVPHDRRWLVTDRAPTAAWASGRAVLLGDAAHPMLQYMAQGACQALEDTVALRDCLTSAETIEQAFTDYAAQRYRRTARVQLTARQFIDICQGDSVLADVRKRFYEDRTVGQLYDGLDWLYSPEAGRRFA